MNNKYIALFFMRNNSTINTCQRDPCHSQKPDRLVKKVIFGIFVVFTLTMTSGCSFKMSRYSDGSLTNYFNQPIPKLKRPLAASLSLEVVNYQTAASMRGVVVSDLGGRGEIFYLPDDVGQQVEELLQLDREFSKDATIAALNAIAKARVHARRAHGYQTPPMAPVTGSGSGRYVEHHSELAREAYSKGDYLRGDIHNAAAANRIAIDQSFGQAQATANLAFGVLGAAAAAGEALYKSKFNNLRNWLRTNSGAIGPEASKNRHLSVFFFEFFDAEPFQLDSRMRVAVMLVLTDKSGIVGTVLEGSDVLNCEKDCNLFTPKPTAHLIDHTTHSEDVRNQLWSKEGVDYLMGNGFGPLGGIYQYLLLQQGLRRLEMAIQK